jgi:hypothetical protein
MTENFLGAGLAVLFFCLMSWWTAAVRALAQNPHPRVGTRLSIGRGGRAVGWGQLVG